MESAPDGSESTTSVAARTVFLMAMTPRVRNPPYPGQILIQRHTGGGTWRNHKIARSEARFSSAPSLLCLAYRPRNEPEGTPMKLICTVLGIALIVIAAV